MNIWAALFGGGNPIKDTGDALDKLFTSDEERLQARQMMAELEGKLEAGIQQQMTDRWKADMASDSWLSKNVRPAILIAMTITFITVLVWGMIEPVPPEIVNGAKLAFSIVAGAYFGGREIGKGIINWKKKK